MTTALHSIRLYEKDNTLTTTSTIAQIVEEQIKIICDGKPMMVDAIGIVLTETIFHPQGGGQPADKGTINSIAVLAVRENREQLTAQDKPTIYHYFNCNEINSAQFVVGQTVTLHVDNEFRQQCRRSHSAGHLIADVLEHDDSFSLYQAKSTQGHHFPGGEYIKALVNALPANTETFCQQLNDGIKELVNANLPVANDEINNIRHIKIGDSVRMCGGTHVNFTKELDGCIVTKIKAKQQGKQTELTIFYQC